MTLLYIQIGLFVLTTIATVFNVFSYVNTHRHRVIYEIKKHRLVMPTGSKEDVYIAKADLIGKVNEDLRDGKYTILGIVPLQGDMHLFLGKIKK